MKFLLRSRVFECLVLSLFLISCGDDGDQPLPSTNPPPPAATPPPPINTNPVSPNSILTLIIGSNRFEVGSENWIFITTEDGELMDVKQVENGQTVNFTSAIDASKFNVTWLEHTLIPSSGAPSDLFFNFQTFLDISNGSEIVWQNKPGVPQGLFTSGNVQLKFQIILNRIFLWKHWLYLTVLTFP